MYIYTYDMPKETLPTIGQQVMRASRQLNLKYRISTTESCSSLERRQAGKRMAPFTTADDQPTRLDYIAMHVANKLAKVAFCRYAGGSWAKAHRSIPREVSASHEHFASLVQQYVEQLVKPGNKVVVTHESGRVYLHVRVREGVIAHRTREGVRLTVQE